MVEMVTKAATHTVQSTPCKVRLSSYWRSENARFTTQYAWDFFADFRAPLGVIRFLSAGWHNNERDRNSGDIVRAEQKAKIGKLEGELRTHKKLNESMTKHLKIIETALKKERENTKSLRAEVKALRAGETFEEKKHEQNEVGEGTKARQKRKQRFIIQLAAAPNSVDLASLSKYHNSFLDIENEESMPSDMKQDPEREKSRLYLGKCVQEVTYHAVPTTASQQQLAEEQEQILQNQQFHNQQMSQQPLEEVYVQQRLKQQPNHIGFLGSSSLPNHQHPPDPRISDPSLSRQQPAEQSAFMSRSAPEPQSLSQSGPLGPIDNRNSSRSSYEFSQTPEEHVEKVLHRYDAYGQPIPSTGENENGRIAEESAPADTDGWNFDDPQEPDPEVPMAFSGPLQRPDTDAFPDAKSIPVKSPPRGGPGSHRRKNSLSKRRQSDGSHELRELSLSQGSNSTRNEPSSFKVRFALRGHVDVVRSVIFTGGGSPSEPEICTAGDDGTIKRWIIPPNYGYSGFTPHGGSSSSDLDVSSYFTHRGHEGPVMSLAASPASQNFSNGGRALGDGWVFSGGEDASIRVWERGRVDPKATLDGHTDSVWTLCVLPGSSASILGDQSSRHGGPDRIILASGSADGTILIWAVSAPPMLTSPHTGSRRAGGSRRANSVSSGSNFPSSPQPSTATMTPFHYSLVHRIERMDRPSPTCICPLSMSGDTFVVSYSDASVLIYDSRTAEEVVGMASLETYDSSTNTSVNAVAATTIGLDGALSFDSGRGITEDENQVHGATGSSSGVEGMILSGHEDRYIRFFDANSGELPFLLKVVSY